MKLRVVIVNDYGTECGGASNVAVRQAQGLAARGHEVVLFSAAKPQASTSRDGVRHVSSGQHDLLDNPSRAAAAVQGLWNRRAARQLSSLLRGSDPAFTVVHLHSWTKALSSSAIAAIANSGLPAVCTLHDYFVACPNGGFFNYQTSQACTLSPLGPACIRTHCDARSYSHKLWRVARQVVQARSGGMPGRMRHFICVSEFNRDHLEPYLPAGSSVHLVPSAVDIERQTPLPAEQRNDIVFVGRLAPEKGVLTYLEACRIAAIKPVLLGTGELSASIRSRYPEADISGWLPPAELYPRVRGALALAFPSLAYEAQPLTILEAAAMGVPAIVSRHCAGARYVTPGVTGEWVDAGDASALAVTMRRQLEDKAQTVRTGQTAYDRFWASDEFRFDRWMERLEQVYARCISDSRLPAAGRRQ